MTGTRAMLCVMIAFLCNATCLAHGVRHTVFEGAFGIEFRYDDGTPISHSEVKVFSPVDGETEFQEGFTDKNGRFTFCPDTAGTWRVALDDGMGHALSEDIKIKNGMKLARETRHGFSRIQGVIIGLSVIFGVFGLSGIFLHWRRSC